MKYITDEEIERLGLEDTGLDIEYSGLVCRVFGSDYEWYLMLMDKIGHIVIENGNYRIYSKLYKGQRI